MFKYLIASSLFLVLAGCASNSAPIHHEVRIIEKERIVQLEKQLPQEEEDASDHEIRSSFGNPEADYLRKNAERSFNGIKVRP
ncbi:MAG: hypothetical protein WC823_04885 [Parcubacteria group bacterium]|jgi:hypothetical protein